MNKSLLLVAAALALATACSDDVGVDPVTTRYGVNALVTAGACEDVPFVTAMYFTDDGTGSVFNVITQGHMPMTWIENFDGSREVKPESFEGWSASVLYLTPTADAWAGEDWMWLADGADEPCVMKVTLIPGEG